MKGIESRRKKVERVSEAESNLAEKVERIEEAGERWRKQRESMEFVGKKEERIEKVEEVDEVKHEGIYRDNRKGNSPDEEDRDDVVVGTAVPTDDKDVGVRGIPVDRARALAEELKRMAESHGDTTAVDEKLKLEQELKKLRAELEELQKEFVAGGPEEAELLTMDIEFKLEVIKIQEKELAELEKLQTKNIDMMIDW